MILPLNNKISNFQSLCIFQRGVRRDKSLPQFMEVRSSGLAVSPQGFHALSEGFIPTRTRLRHRKRALSVRGRRDIFCLCIFY
jgi:hypothetical protein